MKRPRFFPKKGMAMPAPMPPMGPTMGAMSPMGMGPVMGAMSQMPPMGPVMGAMGQMTPGCGYPETKPSQYYPPQVLPAQYSPVNKQVQVNQQDVYVPIIHPTQTTQINQKNYKYVHYYPQSTNVVNQATQQNLCGTQQAQAGVQAPLPYPPQCPPPCPPCKPSPYKY